MKDQITLSVQSDLSLRGPQPSCVGNSKERVNKIITPCSRFGLLFNGDSSQIHVSWTIFNQSIILTPADQS